MAKEESIAPNQRLAFEALSEIGIIHELARTRLERRLPDGLTYAQYSVLTHMIRTSDGRTPSDLARSLQVPRSNMTYTLSRLVANKLVLEAPDGKDGRGKLIYLTKKGRHMRERAIRAIGPEFDVIAKRFDIGRLKALMPVLADLREVMDLYRDE